MTNQWYELLSKDQRDRVYRNRGKQIGKYFALWCESGHLNKFMVTLSPSTNTLDATIALRRNFFKQLNNLKHYHNFTVAYYSAIEIGLNKNPPSKIGQITEERRMKLKQKNFHIHIQLLTDMKKSDIATIISRMNHKLFYYSKVTIPRLKGAKYDYVIKDIKSIDWKLQYIVKTQYKRKLLYTTSRKTLADFLITKIWNYMKKTYQKKWSKDTKDKYLFIMNLKKRGDLVLMNNAGTIERNVFDLIHIKNKGIYIYIKKNVL